MLIAILLTLQDHYYYECDSYTEDFSSLNYIVSPAFIISFVMTFAISFIGVPIMARMLLTSEKYPTLEEKKRCFTHTVASTLQSFFVVGMCAYLVITGDLGKNLAYSKSDAGFILLQVTIGFFWPT